MNRRMVAEELVKIAKSLNAGINDELTSFYKGDEADIHIDKYYEQKGTVYDVCCSILNGIRHKRFLEGNEREKNEILKALSNILKSLPGIEAAIKKEIDFLKNL